MCVLHHKPSRARPLPAGDQTSWGVRRRTHCPFPVSLQTASVALSFLTNLRSRLTKGATLTAAAPIGVTESGALQLALDCHVVAGPAMTDATSSDGSRAVSESLRQTLQVVSSPLDPIDWAAYEAPLKNLASQALAGVSHLVGLLGSNASGSVTRAASGATPTSTLGPTPAVPRFAYLPFSGTTGHAKSKRLG